MNRKAFYPASRAHHAVCMMIDFGMKFVKRNGDFWTVEGMQHLAGSNYDIEVAAESMSLLEPAGGDLAQSKGYTPVSILHRIGVGQYEGALHGGSMAFIDAKQMIEAGYKIIQRHGKPFHWPEFRDA